MQDMQSCHLKSLLASMHAPTFNYSNRGMISTWFAKRSSMQSSIQEAIAEQDGRKVVIERFRKMLLDGHHRCTGVHYPKAGDVHESPEL